MAGTSMIQSDIKSLACRYQTHEKCPGYVLVGVGVNQIRQPCMCTCHGKAAVQDSQQRGKK